MPSENEEIHAALSEIRRREMREVVRAAIKEWLDEQAATFGRWSLRFAIALILSAILYGALVQGGWSPPGYRIEARS